MGVLYTVTVLLLVGLAAADAYGRRRFARSGGVFRCRVRASGDPPTLWPWLRVRWSRRLPAYWIEDVLVVRRGPVLNRSVVLPVRWCDDSTRAATGQKPKRCGDRPLILRLTLVDGCRIAITAGEDARLDLVGPYLSAALRGLPDGPAPGRRVPRTDDNDDTDGGDRWGEKNRRR